MIRWAVTAWYCVGGIGNALLVGGVVCRAWHCRTPLLHPMCAGQHGVYCCSWDDSGCEVCVCVCVCALPATGKRKHDGVRVCEHAGMVMRIVVPLQQCLCLYCLLPGFYVRGIEVLPASALCCCATATASCLFTRCLLHSIPIAPLAFKCMSATQQHLPPAVLHAPCLALLLLLLQSRAWMDGMVHVPPPGQHVVLLSLACSSGLYSV